MWLPGPPEEPRATKTAHEGRVLRDELVSLLRQRGLQVWGHPPTEAGRGQAAQDLGVSDVFSRASLAPRSCCAVPSRPLHRHAPVAQGAGRARRDAATGPADGAQDLETAVELHTASRARAAGPSNAPGWVGTRLLVARAFAGSAGSVGRAVVTPNDIAAGSCSRRSS